MQITPKAQFSEQYPCSHLQLCFLHVWGSEVLACRPFSRSEQVQSSRNFVFCKEDSKEVLISQNVGGNKLLGRSFHFDKVCIACSFHFVANYTSAYIKNWAHLSHLDLRPWNDYIIANCLSVGLSSRAISLLSCSCLRNCLSKLRKFIRWLTAFPWHPSRLVSNVLLPRSSDTEAWSIQLASFFLTESSSYWQIVLLSKTLWSQGL